MLNLYVLDYYPQPDADRAVVTEPELQHFVDPRTGTGISRHPCSTHPRSTSAVARLLLSVSLHHLEPGLVVSTLCVSPCLPSIRASTYESVSAVPSPPHPTPWSRQNDHPLSKSRAQSSSEPTCRSAWASRAAPICWVYGSPTHMHRLCCYRSPPSPRKEKAMAIRPIVPRSPPPVRSSEDGPRGSHREWVHVALYEHKVSILRVVRWGKEHDDPMYRKRLGEQLNTKGWATGHMRGTGRADNAPKIHVQVQASFGPRLHLDERVM